MPDSDSWKLPVSLNEVVEKYGEWTANAIYLGEGQYTKMPPLVDHRLRSFMQIISDLSHKPFDKLRVLDIACCEGHYGLELALHGAEVVAIEIRDANLAKAHFVKKHLRLDNFKLYQDDIRNLSKEKYGVFDVVLCAGILYHLDAVSVFSFVRNIFEVCERLAIFDTFISLNPRRAVDFEGKTYYGLNYVEHEKGATEEDKLLDVWSSVGNDSSFWLTQPSLCRLLEHVGFSSFYECLFPAWEKNDLMDRRTYVAVKCPAVKLLSSPITSQAAPLEIQDNQPLKSHCCQKPQGFLFLLVKRVFPQSVKDVIKPILRLLRIIPPDGTPSSMKQYLKKNKNKRCPPTADH